MLTTQTRKKPKTYTVRMAIMEGLYNDPTRLKAYESSSNRVLFNVRWNRKSRNSQSLPVFTMENELIGYINLEMSEIKQMFLQYSDPVALLIARNHGTILFDLYFSDDKEYLEELKRQNGFTS